MSRKSEAYLRGVPSKPYDLLREGLVVFGLVTVIVFILAIFLSSPDYPAVRGEDVAQRQPIAYLKTAANILAGNSGVQDYGPPYTSDTANAQQAFGIAPADWLGVTIPIDAARDLVLQPLARLALLNNDVAGALQAYRSASPDQQQGWLKSYLAALDHATVVDGQVQLPKGDYGPVEPMMNGMLLLGRAGLLEGAIESGPRVPYVLDFTKSLLFFQDDVDHSVAQSLDLLGEQWGVSHETGPYPGAWWLWPYTFFYQIPPIAASPNGDLIVGALTAVFFLSLLFIPFIPILNRLPRWLGIYKLIWRDWYRRAPRVPPPMTGP